MYTCPTVAVVLGLLVTSCLFNSLYGRPSPYSPCFCRRSRPQARGSLRAAQQAQHASSAAARAQQVRWCAQAAWTRSQRPLWRTFAASDRARVPCRSWLAGRRVEGVVCPFPRCCRPFLRQCTHTHTPTCMTLAVSTEHDAVYTIVYTSRKLCCEERALCINITGFGLLLQRRSVPKHVAYACTSSNIK